MRSLKVFLLSITIFSLMYSQDEVFNHKYALSFGIANNFMLDNFILDISVKKIFDDAHQMRLFVSPRLSTSVQDDDTHNNTTVDFSLGAGADYLWIVLTEDDMNMFTGTGLVFSYAYNFQKSTAATLGGGENIDEYSNPIANVGVRGILGVEWKVTKHIGLHSEYLFTGSYYWNWSESKRTTSGITSPAFSRTYAGLSIGSRVLFGLSVYL